MILQHVLFDNFCLTRNDRMNGKYCSWLLGMVSPVIEWDFLKQPRSVKLSNQLVLSHSFAPKWQSCYAWFVVDYLKECKMLFWLNLIK